MSKFKMVKYHEQTYPQNIPLSIEEVAAHFDTQSIKAELDFSLHTEYSYDKRKFNSSLITAFPELTLSQKDGVPQLWKNDTWALQFVDFIVKLVGDNNSLKTIEIHPPFNDYSNINSFVDIYSKFENTIRSYYPDIEILIENRCGSRYKGGKFILSKTEDIFELANLIKSKNLTLKMAYDIPQIYTAHNAKTESQYITLLNEIKSVSWFIGGVHLWGKRLSKSGRKVAHCGDLTSYFGDESTKRSFLELFNNCFNDEIVRKMVLEVNSGNDDLLSIVNDLLASGVIFI